MEFELIEDFTLPNFRRAFKQYFKELGIEIDHDHKMFKSMTDDGGNYAFTLTIEADMVAFIQFRVDQLNHWFFSEKFLFIREFWVKENLRNKQLGSQLLERCEQYAKEQKLTKIILTSDTAEHFYLKHGFIIDGSMSAKNGDPVFVKFLG